MTTGRLRRITAVLEDRWTDRRRAQELRSGPKQARDYQQLWSAAERGRVLVTHNEKHFFLLHGAWLLWSERWGASPTHSGILIIPQWTSKLSHWAPEHAARELSAFVRAVPSLSNTLYIWKRSSGWTLLEP